MTSQVGIWRVSDQGPSRIERSNVELEAHLEDWIESNPTLLAEGLRVVGRQVHVPGGFIDLLCVDVQGRWVVIELKRGRLYRDALVQALDYAASIRSATPQELRDQLLAASARYARTDEELSLVHEQIDYEDRDREVSILVAGLGVDPGLERVMDFLMGYDLPISVVLFQVFALGGTDQLLVREIIDEEQVPNKTTAPKGSRTVEDISSMADDFGVGSSFRRIIDAAENSDALAVRPYKQSVMIAPSQMKNRFLMVLTPTATKGLRINHGPEAFAEFFLGLTAKDVEDALGPSGDRWFDGTVLDTQTSVIEQFFEELPEPEADPDEPKATRDNVFPYAAAVAAGEWVSYGDLSRAIKGKSSAAMAIGQMAANDPDFPNPHRILNSTGKIPSGWRSETGGGPAECRERLEAEGIIFKSDGSAEPHQRLDVDALRARANSG